MQTQKTVVHITPDLSDENPAISSVLKGLVSSTPYRQAIERTIFIGPITNEFFESENYPFPDDRILYSSHHDIANHPCAGNLSAVLSRAAVAGLALTAAGALVVALGAPWLLRLFGAEYAREASALLRWLALAAPFAVLAQLYFTRLRVQKRVGRLVLLSGVIAACTLGLAAALMPHYGIAASAIGWLLGNSLVAALALYEVWRERSPGKEQS